MRLEAGYAATVLGRPVSFTRQARGVSVPWFRRQAFLDYGLQHAATTSYTYYNDGRKATSTESNQNTTTYNYDQLNAETLPTGPPTQTRTYDAAGNLQTLTDYNGKTTTYTYDSMNRLLSRTPDPSLTDQPETFTYTATGKRATMTDASARPRTPTTSRTD